MARGDEAIRDAERAFEAEPTSENKEQFMTAATVGATDPMTIWSVSSWSFTGFAFTSEASWSRLFAGVSATTCT